MGTTEVLAHPAAGMSRRMAWLLLAGANALWGSAWPVAKVATAEIEPSLLAALRITLASLLFWVVWFWQRARQPQQPEVTRAVTPLSRSEIARMLVLGIFALGISYLLLYTGLGMTTSSDGSLMIIGEVIFTTLLAAWLAHEALDRRKIGGIVLGSLGVVVLVLGGAAVQSGGGFGRIAGDLLILAGLFVQASYTILGAGMSRRSSPLTTMAIVYSGSLLIWLPLIGWHLAQGSLAMPSLAGVLSIIYLAAIPSVGCNLAWFSVLRSHGAGIGAVSLFIQPLVGALLGVLALGEPLTAALLGGGMLIFAALGLLIMQPREIVNA